MAQGEAGESAKDDIAVEKTDLSHEKLASEVKASASRGDWAELWDSVCISEDLEASTAGKLLEDTATLTHYCKLEKVVRFCVTKAECLY